MLTQQGSKLFAGNIPEKDATVVKRFKDAGAIPLAKTNLPEFAAWWETDNALTGRTNNSRLLREDRLGYGVLYSLVWRDDSIPPKVFQGSKAEMYPIASALIYTPPPAFADYVDAVLKVELLKSLFAGYFEKYDVLLCPVLPFTAQPHNYGDVVANGVTVPNYHVMKPTLPFNMTGLPGLSVPYTFSSEQLPINVQLVSRWLDEETILGLGLLIEAGNKVNNHRPNL